MKFDLKGGRREGSVFIPAGRPLRNGAGGSGEMRPV